jgi:hypothetical protein
MSDMLKDGASGGAGPLPPDESHDEFLELCATATTGSLDADERRRLQEHLTHCQSCREMMAQYQAIVDRVIPAWAPLSAERDPAPSGWSEELAEAELFARLRSDKPFDEYHVPEIPLESKSSPPAGKSVSSEEALWGHMWVQFAAALLLVAALGMMAYRIGKRRGIDLAAQHPASSVSPAASDAPAVPKAPVVGQAPSSATKPPGLQAEALQSELEKRLAEIDRLRARQVQTENNIKLQEADRIKLAQDRADLRQQLDAAQRNLAAAEQRADSAANQGSEERLRNAALQQRVDELTRSVRERDQEVARERELLDHDRDIRELMGSRDLYIAEVYDVAKTGDTQKPFGRVFYTRGKSLIFYAYDLDQQAGMERASTFQAWGRVGPDRDRAINLGILYQDNANKKRWVLKSDNPKTLAQIDAVFVTVEPNGGSAHPSGKPLLFAYLRVQPNHP